MLARITKFVLWRGEPASPQPDKIEGVGTPPHTSSDSHGPGLSLPVPPTTVPQELGSAPSIQIQDNITAVLLNDLNGATSNAIITKDLQPKPNEAAAINETVPKLKDPVDQQAWVTLTRAGHRLFGQKSVSFQSARDLSPIGTTSALLIHRPDGPTRMYTAKDGSGTKSVLSQMAIDSGALDFMTFSDDAVCLRKISLVPREATQSGLPRLPEIVETINGYIFTELPNPSSNPSLHNAPNAMYIDDWYQKENKRDHGVAEASWLATMAFKSNRKAIREDVEGFLKQQSEKQTSYDVIPPLAAVSHGRLMPTLWDNNPKYLSYDEYESKTPMFADEIPSHEEIVEYVESMVYDVVAVGISITLSYTMLRDDKGIGAFSYFSGLLSAN
ncbi:hypothetical protein FRB95_010936 [Tulasnella sp. JGI-2019a]|nr:hypothetical protein FRB95_010936 [Tulasnella sp. JGI-2019a]